MRLTNLLATTAFRVALANAAAFSLVGIIVFAVLFALSRERILSALDSDLAADGRTLLVTFADAGPSGLLTTMERRVAAGPGSHDFYLLHAADGQLLARNLPDFTIPPQWAWVRVPGGQALGLPDGMLRTVSVDFPNGWRLLIGSNPRQLYDLRNIFLGALLWTELGIILFGLASGYFVSRRVLRGVQTIADEAALIGEGEIDRRIPRLSGGDEIARIGAAVNLMLDRIGALTGNLRQVTDDIAHDLRTPLSRLRQKLERASLHDGSAADLRATMEQALAETDAIIATFNALLRIAQIEGQDRRAGFSDVDLSGLVSRLAEIYGPSAEDAGHHMRAEISPGLHVRGDADMLGQMVANLIENGMRHTPPGTRLSVDLHEVPQGARLTIADNGPGIPPDERGRVFGRFVRLDASRGTPGTGLGLALVKAVADLHGASVALEDNAPGLRVSVAFPRP